MYLVPIPKVQVTLPAGSGSDQFRAAVAALAEAVIKACEESPDPVHNASVHTVVNGARVTLIIGIDDEEDFEE